MSISKDKQNRRANAGKGAAAQTAAPFTRFEGFAGDAPTVARMQDNQILEKIAQAEQRRQQQQDAAQANRALTESSAPAGEQMQQTAQSGRDAYRAALQTMPNAPSGNNAYQQALAQKSAAANTLNSDEVLRQYRAGLLTETEYETLALAAGEQERQTAKEPDTSAEEEAADILRQQQEAPAYYEALRTARESGNKQTQYEAVNSYFESNSRAKKLWSLERGITGNGLQGALNAEWRGKQAAALRNEMTPDELAAYEEAKSTYDAYGRVYSAGARAGDMAAGSLKSAYYYGKAFMQAAGKEYTAPYENQYRQGTAQRKSGDAENPTSDEVRRQYLAGEISESEYETLAQEAAERETAAAKEAYTKAPKQVIDEKTAPALAQARQASEQVARGRAGLQGITGKGYDLGASMVQNAPSMAMGVIPVVGQALSLGTMGAAAAGQRMDELGQRGITSDEAIARAAVSGGIEIATEVLPLSSWTEILTKGGETALRNMAKQAFGEATEEGASYILNYLSDLAAKDPEAEFSWDELADSMAMGAASGVGYGLIGTGVNRLLGGKAQAANGADAETVQQEETAQAVQDNAAVQQRQAVEAEAAKTELQRRATAEAFAQMYPGVRAEDLMGDTAAVQQNTAATAPAVQMQQNSEAAAATEQAAQQVQAGKVKVRTVEQWARENETFSPQMRQLAEQSYTDGTNARIYEHTLQGVYDAGRSGSLTYEQAMANYETGAAVLGNEALLKQAYALGREQMHDAADAAGSGAVQGRVTYADGATQGLALDDTVLQAAAAKLGVDIKVVQQLSDNAGGEANGHFAAALSQIALGENSGNAYETLVHELTHYMGSYNAQGWNGLKNAVLQWYAREGSEYSQTMQRYGDAYGDYTLGADEAARDVLSGVMSTEDGARSFLEYLTQEPGYTTEEKKSILQTLRDMLTELVSKVRSMLRGGDATRTAQEARMLAERAESLDVRRQLIESYLQELETARQNAMQGGAQAGENENAPAASRGDTTYSKGVDADGNVFVRVDEDILDGVPEKDVINKVKHYLREKYPNGFTRNGWKVELTRKSIGEFTNSEYSKKLRYNDSETYLDKMRTAANLDEIIDAADHLRAEDLNHPRKDDIVSFNRANVQIEIGGKMYTADVLTGIKADSREIFYDIVNITPATKKVLAAIQASTQRATDTVDNGKHLSANTIQQGGENVNPDAKVQKMTVQSLGATKALGAGGLPSSATVNNTVIQGGENVNTDEARHSYAGTLAADADSQTLQHAQEMERDGADWNEIRNETGWFRGADNKWRFEIDDSKTAWHRSGDYRMMQQDADYREYKTLTQQMLYGTLTVDETARLQQLSKEYRNAANGSWKTLGDYLEAPELYRQYPELQSEPVEFRKMAENTKGVMSRLDGIVLNENLRTADADTIKQTVLHEVQHWIQRKEGFAQGASPEYWQQRLAKNRYVETKGMRDAKQQLAELEAKHPQIAALSTEYNNAATVEDAARVAEKAKRYGITEDELENHYLDKVTAEERVEEARTPQRLYYDTAGEQEARDTVRRMQYDTEQRRENAPYRGDSNTVFAEKNTAAYDIDPDFDRRITEWDKNGRSERQIFTLGTTSDTLKSIGVWDKSIVMVSDKVRTIMKKHPEMTIDMVRQIPYMLEHPALVLESGGGSMRTRTAENTRLVVVGNVTDAKGNPVLSVLDLKPSTGTDMRLGLQDFNKVSSAYAKTSNPRGLLEKSNVLYVSEDTKKADAALNSFGFKFATTELNRIGSIGTIAYDDGKVNIKGVPFKDLLKSGDGGTKKAGEGNNSFGFQFATSELNHTGSEDSIEHGAGNVNPQSGKNTLPAAQKRFSLKEPLEATKDLVAVHNVDEDGLMEALQLGGLPMPSIAIVKAEQGHSKYGPISLVFGRDTIDPAVNTDNKVYGGDGWTPTKPKVDYAVNEQAATAFDSEIRELAGNVANGAFTKTRLLATYGIEGDTSLKPAELANKVAADDAVRAAYLADTGKNIEPVLQEKKWDRYGNENLQKLIDAVGTKELNSMKENLALGKGLTEKEKAQIEAILRDYYRDTGEAMLQRAAKKRGLSDTEIAQKRQERIDAAMERNVTPFTLEDFVNHAWQMHEDGGKTKGEIDRMATSDKLREAVDDSEVREWVKGKLDGVLGEAGIYNGKDPYTASGNRRSFAQLHNAYTLENIVRAMKDTQQERGEGTWGVNAETLQAVSAEDYSNVDEIKADSGKLGRADDAARKAQIEAADKKITDIMAQIRREAGGQYSNQFEEADVIATVMKDAAGKKTAAAIRRHFAGEGFGISTDTAQKLLSLYKEAANLPTEYFEAKPRRAVGFDEVRAAIVPDNTSEKLLRALNKAGVTMVEYEAGNEDARLKALNAVEDVKFSKQNDAVDLANERKWRQQAETQAQKAAREKARMADQIELLKQETKLSGGHLMDVAEMHKAVTNFLRNYSSKIDAVQFERDVRSAFEAMSRSKNSNVQEAMATLEDLARSAIEQSSEINTELREAYAPIRDDVRKMEWSVRKNSPEYSELLYRYGDGENGTTWGNVRKALFGRINVKMNEEKGNSGTFDTNFEVLAAKYPGMFNADDDVGQNVEKVMQLFEASKPQYDNPYGYDIDEAAAYAAQELYDAYLQMPRRTTFADAKAAQAERIAKQYSEQRQTALNEQKARYEQKIAEMRKYNADRLNELNRQYRQAQTEHDKQRLIDTHNQIAEVRRSSEEKYLRRKAALELRWQVRAETAQAKTARDGIQKNVRDLHRWLTKPTAQQHVQSRMQRVVLNLLNSIDPNTSADNTKTAARWQEMMKDVQLMAKDAIAADGGIADTDAYADFDPDLPNMIGTLVQGAEERLSVAEMNSRQLKQLNDILTSMKTSINNANRMMSDAKGRSVDEVAMQTAREMDTERTHLLREQKNALGKAVRGMQDTDVGERMMSLLNTDMMDARRYFSTLGSTAEKAVYEPIRKGFDKRVWLLQEAQDKFAEIKGKADIKKWTGDKAEKKSFTLHDGKTVKMTVGQMMELYNLTQRQQAHEHLVQGGVTLVNDQGKKISDRLRLNPTDIAKITGALTPEQVRMAQNMSRYLSTDVARWGNEVTQELYGLDKFKEKHYWPISTDGNQTRTSDANVSGNAGLWGVKNKSFTQNTVDFANNSILLGDAFDTFSNHVTDMATYNAWCIPLSDAMKWFNWRSGVDVSTKEQIERLMGGRGKGYFTTLMQDINGISKAPSSTGYASLTKSLTRNWKVAKVGANLRVAIQQPTAYLRAAAVMDPKYLAQALASPNRLKHGMQMADEHCAIAKWKSWGFFETNMGQTMKSVLTGESNTLDKVREFSTKLAELGDTTTWGTLWNACEFEAKDKGYKAGTEEFNRYCADRMSEIVDKTQVVDSVLHRSHIMRSKDPIAQMATNFFAEPTKTYNMVNEALLDVMHGKAGSLKKFGRVTATYLATAMGTAAAASLIDGLRVKDEDKDKGYMERYLQALQENLVDNVNIINNIPLVKDVKSIFDGYDATRTDMETASDMYDAVTAWQKYLNGESKTTPYKLVYKTANAVSDLTGIPFGTAMRDAKSMYDIVTGMQDPLRLDRQFNRAEDDYSYIDLYNQVKAADGMDAAQEFRRLYNGEGYADKLGTDKAAKVDTWLQALAVNTGTMNADGSQKPNSSVLAKNADNEITYKDRDGNEATVKLRGKEYKTYLQSIQKSTVNLIAEYMDGAGKSASADAQADFVAKAREYAVETARQNAIPGYVPENWVLTVQELSGGKNIAKAIVAKQATAGAQSDKDADGNVIDGSKAANGVAALQEQGYTAAEAQAIYNQMTGSGERYTELYNDVKSDSAKSQKLAALYGVGGGNATYAGMLQKPGAKAVDSYLQTLSKTAGNDVLPDRMSATFKVGNSDVELTGKQYVDYAENRTQTAYDILAEAIPTAKRYSKDFQADVVNAVEDYATQTAKERVSSYEPKSWVLKIQESGADSPEELARYILARELIQAAQGTKNADGKTVSGSKKADALNKLQDAGYTEAMAEEMYKMFK